MTTSDTAIEPRQPRRFEKKRNIGARYPTRRSSIAPTSGLRRHFQQDHPVAARQRFGPTNRSSAATSRLRET